HVRAVEAAFLLALVRAAVVVVLVAVVALLAAVHVEVAVAADRRAGLVLPALVAAGGLAGARLRTTLAVAVELAVHARAVLRQLAGVGAAVAGLALLLDAVTA